MVDRNNTATNPVIAFILLVGGFQSITEVKWKYGKFFLKYL